MDEVKKIAASSDIAGAMARLDAMIDASESDSGNAKDAGARHTLAEAYFMRGRLHWKLGARARAMADYAHAADLDPDSGAVRALEMARDIEAFFNPDMLNP